MWSVSACVGLVLQKNAFVSGFQSALLHLSGRFPETLQTFSLTLEARCAAVGFTRCTEPRSGGVRSTPRIHSSSLLKLSDRFCTNAGPTFTVSYCFGVLVWDFWWIKMSRRTLVTKLSVVPNNSGGTFPRCFTDNLQ